MVNLLQGHEATCPHCWETIELTLDMSVEAQSYIEDCPVCCKPMAVSYVAKRAMHEVGAIAEVWAESGVWPESRKQAA